MSSFNPSTLKIEMLHPRPPPHFAMAEKKKPHTPQFGVLFAEGSPVSWEGIEFRISKKKPRSGNWVHAGGGKAGLAQQFALCLVWEWRQ